MTLWKFRMDAQAVEAHAYFQYVSRYRPGEIHEHSTMSEQTGSNHHRHDDDRRGKRRILRRRAAHYTTDTVEGHA